jgi:hypothetical protein
MFAQVEPGIALLGQRFDIDEEPETARLLNAKQEVHID